MFPNTTSRFRPTAMVNAHFKVILFLVLALRSCLEIDGGVNEMNVFFLTEQYLATSRLHADITTRSLSPELLRRPAYDFGARVPPVVASDREDGRQPVVIRVTIASLRRGAQSWLRSVRVPFVAIVTEDPELVNHVEDECPWDDILRHVTSAKMFVRAYVTRPLCSVDISVDLIPMFTKDWSEGLANDSLADPRRRFRNRTNDPLYNVNTELLQNSIFPTFDDPNVTERPRFLVISLTQRNVQLAVSRAWLTLAMDLIPVLAVTRPMPHDGVITNVARLFDKLPCVIMREIEMSHPLFSQKLETIWEHIARAKFDWARMSRAFWSTHIFGSTSSSSDDRSKNERERGRNEGVAVIIETRRNPFLIPIVRHTMSMLGSDWRVQIFHGPSNKDLITYHPRLSTEYVGSGSIELVDMIPHETFSRKTYNEMMTSAPFWNACEGDQVLIFQTDSIICASSSRNISSFLDVDYVGAPWQPKYPLCPSHVPSVIPTDRCQGNGGFSLRKKAVMKKIIDAFAWDSSNEDVFLSSRVLLVGGTMATTRDAATFSVESHLMYDPEEIVPFGVHRPHQYLTKETYDKLTRSCPEATMIFEMSTAWHRSGQRDESTFFSLQWSVPDTLAGQFVRVPQNSSLWFVLGRTRRLVSSCEMCASEYPCRVYVETTEEKLSGYEELVSTPYVCGAFGAYVDLNEMVVRENNNNRAAMPHEYHIARESRVVLAWIVGDDVDLSRSLAFVVQGMVDEMSRSNTSTGKRILYVYAPASNDEDRCRLLEWSSALELCITFVENPFEPVLHSVVDTLYVESNDVATARELLAQATKRRIFDRLRGFVRFGSTIREVRDDFELAVRDAWLSDETWVVISLPYLLRPPASSGIILSRSKGV